MLYLAAQIWLHLGLAFALGGGIVWWHLRRSETARRSEVLPDSEPPRALLARLTADRTELELAVSRLSAELALQGNAADNVSRRLAATESELMDSASAQERLASEAVAGNREVASARSELQHAREELLLKTDELAHRRAEWIEESASQREEIEDLRSQLGRRRPKSPRIPRLEPRLPDQLVLNDNALENRGADETALKGAASTRDDLTQIKGIGRVLAGRLNEMGIYTFSEIATWTGSDIERIQASLPQLSGRIRRDEWVSQAAQLDHTAQV